MRTAILGLLMMSVASTSLAQDYWASAGLGVSDVLFLTSGPGGYIYAGIDVPGVPASHQIYRKSDEGASWQEFNNGLPSRYLLQQLFTDTANFVYAAVDSQLYRLSTADTAWILIYAPGSGQVIVVGTANSTGLVFVGVGPNIFKSTDAGDSWKLSYSPTEPNEAIRSILLLGNGNLIASIKTFPGDAWVVGSADGGNLWNTISTFNYYFDLLIETPTGSILGIEKWSVVSSLFHSGDEGITWTVRQYSLDGGRFSSLIFDSGGVLHASGNAGVFQSVNEGQEFSEVTNNLPTNIVHALSVGPDGHLYAGTLDHGVWRSISKVTAVDDSDDSATPDKFTLSQNYPNPFNSTTTIEYEVMKDGFVLLEIFNIAGERVASLVNQIEHQGIKSVRWEAKDAPSGIYYYRLDTGEMTKIRKMILLK